MGTASAGIVSWCYSGASETRVGLCLISFISVRRLISLDSGSIFHISEAARWPAVETNFTQLITAVSLNCNRLHEL